jgi:hypothetical protein
MVVMFVCTRDGLDLDVSILVMILGHEVDGADDCWTFATINQYSDDRVFTDFVDTDDRVASSPLS